MIKKTLCLALCFCFCFCFTACSGNEENVEKTTKINSFLSDTTLNSAEKQNQDITYCTQNYIYALYQDWNEYSLASVSSIYLRSKMYDVFVKNEKKASFDLNFELDDNQKYAKALKVYFDLLGTNGNLPHTIQDINIMGITIHNKGTQQYKTYLSDFNKQEKAENIEKFATVSLTFNYSAGNKPTTPGVTTATQKGTSTTTKAQIKTYSGRIALVETGGNWYILDEINE